ncbi:hypothetical protein JZ751_023741 [Albula glossodonta]|uniref:IMD domain-containing protein n=1 Tax=Albula glossodonta TaxID=121402 RepID=A0A8T2NGH2_9TELE|nr:hypothetical protein JZ751_023741 [Albula glossodonta]
MEEWKRGANTLDKDHAKEYKKARQEIKKKSSDTLKLQKKAKKGQSGLNIPCVGAHFLPGVPVLLSDATKQENIGQHGNES